MTIKLDRNWNSFQLANSAPPLSVTDSAIAPSARIGTQLVERRFRPQTIITRASLAKDGFGQTVSTWDLLGPLAGAPHSECAQPQACGANLTGQLLDAIRFQRTWLGEGGWVAAKSQKLRSVCTHGNLQRPDCIPFWIVFPPLLDSAQVCLLCFQPEPMSESLSTRMP